MNVLWSLLALVTSATAGVSVGGNCTVKNDKLNPTNGKFSSDCDETAFCSGAVNGTCQPRRCRRDEFPFGFANKTVPPLCQGGTYCPDEGSGCKPLLAVGQSCQLDRDEQCAPSPNWQYLASEYNFNGSLCLKSVCTFANMSLGQPCIHDAAVYTDGTGYSNAITRHNCHTPDFYCHADLQVCISTKAFGSACAADQECHSFNCGPTKMCADPPGTPACVETWQFVVTGMSAVAAMVAVVIVLTFIHKRLRLKRCKEIREYYEEQLLLRKSLAALHAAAADRYAKEKWYD